MVSNNEETQRLLIYRDMIEAMYNLDEDIFFLINLKTQEIHFWGKTINLFDIEPVMQNFPKCILERDIITDKDLKAILVKKDLISMEIESEFELQVKNKGKQLSWYKCKYKIIYKKDKKNIIGKLVNIDDKRKLDIDHLTGIPSKDKFYEDTEKMLKKYQHKKFFFIRVDVDKFQIINSYFGIREGNRLLRIIANNMSCFGKDILGTFGRIGADVFCGCYEMIYPMDMIIESMIYYINETIDDCQLDYKLRLSVGIYEVNDLSLTIEEMYSRVVMASKECKKKPERIYAIYSDRLMQLALKEQEIINDMWSALEEEQFELFLQPKVSLKSRDIIGLEALVRWNHPVRGYITPTEFIPLFEQNGFITILDYYMWKEVCKFIKNQIDNGEFIVPISINVSRVDLYNKNIVDYFKEILNEYQIPAQYLHIEITESAYTDDSLEIINAVKELKKIGLTIEMDDFGKGYSSLNMFNELPIDVLKLDKDFLKNLHEEENKKIIVSFILSLANTFNITVIAEGIERKEQLEFLNSIGCHIGQGYYFSPPISKEEYKKRVKVKHSFAGCI